MDVIFRELSIAEIPVVHCCCDSVVIRSIPNKDGEGWGWSQPYMVRAGEKIYPYLITLPKLDRDTIPRMITADMQSVYPSFLISSLMVCMRDCGDEMWLGAVFAVLNC